MLSTTFETHHNKKLRVARLGAGRPVILLHGYPENLQVFCKLAPALAMRCNVIAFDWPGMGNSDEWKGGATPVVMAGRLLAMMDAWHLETVDLVAQDMGGQPALVFAALYPERVSSVTVMNSLVVAGGKTSWEIRLLRKFGINKILLRHFAPLVFWRALRTFVPRGYHVDASIRSDMWQDFRSASVRQYIVRMCAGYEAQLSKLPEYYKKIKCPVFILWGEADKYFPPVQAQLLQKLIPQAKLEILPGATHWMAMERANEVAVQILAYYSSL